MISHENSHSQTIHTSVHEVEITLLSTLSPACLRLSGENSCLILQGYHLYRYHWPSEAAGFKQSWIEKKTFFLIPESCICCTLATPDIEFTSCMGFPGGASGKEPTCQSRRPKRQRFNPWVGKILWRRKWQPTPVSLPGESYGQRSLAGSSPWGHRVRHDQRG